MKKVLVVTNNLAGGGAEKVLLMLLSELKPPQYEVDLLLIKNKGVYLNCIPNYVKVGTMIDVTKGDHPFPKEPTVLEEYCQNNIAHDYDVEIAFLEGPPTKLLAHHVTSLARKIAWVHTDLENVHWTYSYYFSDEEERATYEQFDDVVFVSEGTKNAFYKRFGKISAFCHVITNPTDCLTIQSRSQAFEVQQYQFSFCSVASLCVRKGQTRLLYAMGRLFSEGFRFHLNLVGTGDSLMLLKELAHILNIDGYVHFCGFQSNPYPYIKSCTVMISSSISEGFPLVLCEALCLKKPIVATQCVGNHDVLQGGRFGHLVNNTEEGLYIGMKQVLSSPKFLSDLKDKANLGATSLKYDEVFAAIKSLLKKKE